MYKIDILYSQYNVTSPHHMIYHKGKFHLVETHSRTLYKRDNIIYAYHKGKDHTISGHHVRTGKFHCCEYVKGRIIFSRNIIIYIPDHKMLIRIRDHHIKIHDKEIYNDFHLTNNAKNISHYGEWVVFSFGRPRYDILFRFNIREEKIYQYVLNGPYVGSFDNNDWFHEGGYLVSLTGKKLYIGEGIIRYSGNDGEMIRYHNHRLEVFKITLCPEIKRGFEDIIIFFMT